MGYKQCCPYMILIIFPSYYNLPVSANFSSAIKEYKILLASTVVEPIVVFKPVNKYCSTSSVIIEQLNGPANVSTK